MGKIVDFENDDDRNSYLKAAKEEIGSGYGGTGKSLAKKKKTMSLYDEEGEKSFFKKGKGNFFEQAVGTMADTALNIGEGFFLQSEGLADTGQYLLADMFNLFGNKKAANALRENADFNSFKQIFGENSEKDIILSSNDYRKGINTSSVLGEYGDNTTQAIGTTLAAMGMAGGGSAVGVFSSSSSAAATFVPMFLSSYGNTRSETRRAGYDEFNSITASLESGTINGTTELIFGVIPGLNKNSKLGDSIISAVGSGTEKYLGSTAAGVVKNIVGWAGEGAEELLGKMFTAQANDIIHALNKNYTYGMENQTGNIWEDTLNVLRDPETWAEFLTASASAMITSGGSKIVTENQKNKVIKSYAKDNNMTFKDAKTKLENYSNIFEDVMEKGKSWNQQQEVKEQATKNAQDLMKGMKLTNGQTLDVKSIESAVEERLQQEINDKQERIAKATQEINGTPFDLSTEEQLSILQENGLTSLQAPTETEIQQRREELTKNYIDQIQNSDKYSSYQYEKNDKMDSKEVKLRDSAVKYSNNTQEARNLVDTLANIQKTGNTQYELVDTNKLKELGYNVSDDSTINGLVHKSKDGNTIYINVESQKAYETVLGHEITHMLENTSDYSGLRELLYSQKTEAELEKLRSELRENYSEEDIEYELTADLAGELFENENFIKKLSGNRTLLQKMIDFLDGFITKVTGNKEKQRLKAAQKKYIDMYKEMTKTTNENINTTAESEGTQFSVTKQNKQMLEQEFEKLTGDSLLVAEAKLGNYAFQQIQGREVEAPYNKEAMDIYEAIQNSKKTSSHLYHSTPADRIQSIIQNGLQVGSKQNQEGVSSENKLYLSATEELADSFTPEGSVMLRISPNAKLENLDYDLLGGEGSYTITNNIDPKYLQVKENGKWINLLKSSYANDNVQYSLSRDVDTNSPEYKINTSMTMDQAKDLIQRTFIINDIKNLYDGKYQNGDEWLKGEGIDEVEMYAENTEPIQSKFLNQLYDKNNGFQDDYYISDILQAYQDGTLTGEVRENVGRVDTTQDTGFQDSRFYAPRDVELTRELYDKANQRVTNKNREEIYKARADFIIAAHQRGMAQQIGLTQQEVNAKLKSWANYPQKAMELSNQMNENVARQNQWTGLENSSIVNAISVSNEDMGKLVKEIKGDSNGWQRQYITGTMLALDTHIDYSNLTFDFEQGAALREKHAAGDYDHNTDIIRIGEGYQNTVAHEMGHYVDYLWGKQFFNKGMPLSDLVKSYDRTNLSQEQIQFLEHFNQFQESIEASGEKGDTLKYGSSRNAGYWQKPTETFARFVGKFTEWTRNQATNNRYGYDEKYYKDNFTESQYRDFIKLLQEKAAIDTSSNLKYNSLNQELINAIDNLTDEQKADIKNIIDNETNIPSYQVTDDLINILGKDNYYLIGKNKLDELVNRNFYQQTEESTNVQYSISKDNQGRELSKEQQDYYKDSKVRDQDGNLLVMYNGRYSDDTVFKPSRWTNEKNGPTQIKGYFATDSSYSEIYGDVSEYYLNIKNPLYMGLEDGNEALTLNEWQQFFKEHGITGVEFDSSLYGTNTKGNNAPDVDGQKRYLPFEIVDSDEYWNNNGNVTERIKAAGYDGLTWTEGGQAYMPFESNQIKRIDNVDPTTSDDIRYSISKQDNQGRNLSVQQLEYFKNSKVVDDNNNLKEVYHRTYTGGFTVFQNRKGVHWFTDTSNATYYGDNKYSVYLNIENPLVIDAQGKNYNQIEFSQEGLTQYNSTTIKDVIDNIDKATKEDIVNLAQAIDKNNSLGDYIDEFDTPMQMLESVIEAYDEGATIEEFKNGYGGLSMFTENDSIPSRKTTTTQDITDYAKLNGYDGVIFNNIQDMTNGVANVYAAFNPNQIKNVDNLNPTTNEDIRLSMTRNNDIAPTRKKGLTYSEDVIKRDVYTGQLLQPTTQSETQNETELPTREVDLPFDDVEYEEIPTERLRQRIEEKLNRVSDKAIRMSTKDLELTRKEKAQLRDKLSKYKGWSREQLTNAEVYNDIYNMVSDYADRSYIITDEELKAVQKEIRKTPINISPELKNQITDYGDFRKENFGKLRLTDKGNQGVDVVYQELNEMYPQYFKNLDASPADQLYELADFMNRDINTIDEYRLDDTELNNAATQIFNKLITNSLTDGDINELQEKLDKKKISRKDVRAMLRDEMGISIEDIDKGKDISAINVARTDPIRLNEKVFGRELGNKINDATIRKTQHNEADRMRWLNKEREEIKNLGIKPRSAESAAVQKYGEKQFVDKNGEIKQYGDKELAQEFSDKNTQEKIKKAAEVLREKYDNYLDQINSELDYMGYNTIPKRSDYMHHFEELQDVFSKWGTPFNPTSLKENDLPTDINGLTEFNRPGKAWFSAAQQRMGAKTTYDAITGIDQYLEGASNLIYHTQDIQRYRALSEMIRDTYGQTKGFENLDTLSDEEATQRVKDILDNKLSKYAAWLDEQANALAGKKGAMDRSVERLIGRKGYSVMNTLKSQVGSNMTGFNVRSAMTNFISSTIAGAKTNKVALIKGTVSTINNLMHKDGFTDKSDFLTRRYGSDSLSPKLWQKISNAGQIFMNGSDYITSQIITRSKYFEGLQNGMTEEAAIKYADDFAARVMGDRSKGSTAEVFNSKSLGLISQFQLEVNNQLDYMIHDTKMDYQAESNKAKAAAGAVFTLGQIAGYSYFFNELFEQVTGSRAAFDPIEIIKTLFGVGDDDDKTQEERNEEAILMLLENLPFGNILTGGGRIPISSALPITELITGKDQYGNDKSRKKILEEALPYYISPTGFGQAQKTLKSMKMYTNDLPGSYTDSGNLRFTASTKPADVARNLLFGQWSSKEADDYIESGYKSINSKKVPLVKELGLTSSEYREIQSGLSQAGTLKNEEGYEMYKDEDGDIYYYDKNSRQVYTESGEESSKDITTLTKANKKEAQLNYINSLDLPYKSKNALANDLFSSDNTKDKYGYDKYTETITNKNGKEVTKTYYYNPDTDTVYNSKYEVVDKDINKLTKVKSKEINLREMNSFNDYDEYVYSTKNEDKYNWMKSNGISYNDYSKSKESKEAYDWAYNNPNSYTLSKTITNDVVSYKKYKEDIDNIKADKTKSGKTISGSRKKKVVSYINKLDLSYEQKLVLFKSIYKSDKKNNKKIVNYINNMDMTVEEKYTALEKLGYKVDRKKGTVR